MMRVDGLFGAGDTIGRSAHKFSSVSFTEGWIAAKAAVRYLKDTGTTSRRSANRSNGTDRPDFCERLIS